MKKIVIILFAMMLLTVFKAYADDSQLLNLAVVKESIAAFMNENKISGVAVELYVAGEPRSYYFGFADKAKKIRVNKYTIFEIGSISKIMTSILLAQQVDAANLQLSDSLKKFMGELPLSYATITLKDLATHTSGLPFSPPINIKTRSELKNYLTSWSPEDEPGEQWIYSNFGIGMLGYALEMSTHKNFNQLYRSRILSPLGMQPISLHVPKRFKINYAQGYDNEGQLAHPMELGLFPSAVGIKASAIDMKRFLGAAIGLPGTPPQIFYPMRLTQSGFVQLPNKMQGLAWQIHPITKDNLVNLINEPNAIDQTPIAVAENYEKPKFDGDALIDKTGGTRGFKAYIAVIPNKKSGIVILANKAIANNSIVKTGREILFKIAKIKNVDEDDAMIS